jgi:hypothetical protein
MRKNRNVNRCETVRERDHWEDLDVNCEAILTFISKKEVGERGGMD